MRMSTKKLIIVGLPRTGTMSLCTVLPGKVFHGVSFAETCTETDIDFFNRQLAHPDVKEWKEYFEPYDVISDLPALQFIDLHVKAFPNATYVKTTRPVEEWCSSWRKYMALGRTFCLANPDYKPDTIAMLTAVRESCRLLPLSFEAASLDESVGMQFYTLWDEYISNTCPNLVEFKVGTDDPRTLGAIHEKAPLLNTFDSLIVPVKYRWTGKTTP